MIAVVVIVAVDAIVVAVVIVHIVTVAMGVLRRLILLYSGVIELVVVALVR